jgi:trk system potassium uptake protein
MKTTPHCACRRNHSAGGFSTHDASFGHFNSPLLEWICVAFMVIASCNFALYFVALRHRTLARILADLELRGTVALLVCASVLVGCFIHWHGVFPTLGESIRMAFFSTVSIASTTGYATTDYSRWPLFAPVLTILLSGLTTSAGSTGAGIKMIRLVILAKHCRAELLRVLHPKAAVPLVLQGTVVPNAAIQSILTFMLLYGGAIVALSLVLTAFGVDPITAISAVFACINNMGPGLNEIGPAGNFIPLTDFQTWICSFTMILGRLEVMSLLVVLTPEFWRR